MKETIVYLLRAELSLNLVSYEPLILFFAARLRPHVDLIAQV